MTAENLRGGIASVEVTRLDAEGARAAHDEVAVEEPLEIRVGGEALATTMRTPGHDPELVAGLLLAEGVIGSRVDLGSIHHCGRPGDAGHGNVIEVSLTAAVAADFARVERSTLMSSACGVCGRASIDDLVARLAPLDDGARFERGWLAALPAELRERQPNFRRTGGLHAAGLASNGERLALVREDVGRHNAVDKVLGRLLLDGALPARGSALIVSSRTSFEIVQKALSAGVPAVVSISAPSSLAIATAARFGALLIGFARNGAFNVYAGGDRIAA